MSLANATTYKDAAQTAFASGDYATALTNYELLLTELAFIPDSTQSGDSLMWRRDTIEKQIQRCHALLNSSRGIGVSKVVIEPVC